MTLVNHTQLFNDLSILNGGFPKPAILYLRNWICNLIVTRAVHQGETTIS